MPSITITYQLRRMILRSRLCGVFEADGYDLPNAGVVAVVT